MTLVRHIDHDDLALFAMELFSADEATAIIEHLADCPTCSEEAAALRGDLGMLALTSAMHTPPAQARQRLLNQVAREKKPVPIKPLVFEAPDELRPSHGSYSLTGSLQRTSIDEDDLPRPGFGSRVLPWLGWAIAAGVAFTAIDFYHQNQDLRSTIAAETSRLAGLSVEVARGQAIMNTLTDPSAMRVSLTLTPEKPKPQAHTIYVPEKGSLLFTASNLEPLEPYKTYELWLIPADGHDPIPAGTFQPDSRGNATLILPEVPKGVIAKAFGVTIEDAGGSQQPTLPIIMAGA